jgi:hypothetical protein
LTLAAACATLALEPRSLPMNFDDLVAFDIHTQAEEPCDHARDDGYNEFQAGMAAYF